MSTEKYCCDQFKKAVETMNFYKPTSTNKWQIEGYDMDGPYPDLNYCPNCGVKLE